MESLRTRSGVIAEKTSDELFAVDTAGDAAIQKKVQSRHKPLKVDQILAQRSAVPAVPSRKRLSDLDDEGKRKKAKVSGKEYDRLRAIAYGGQQTQKDVVQSAQADYDPWAVQEVVEEPEYSFLEKKKPKVEPNTLKRAPVSLAKDGKTIPAVRKPAAGKSYNPNFDEWQALLIKESEKAVADEKKRLQEAQEEAERMERAAADTESDSGEESVWESEWEGFSEDESKSKAKRPERKSATQRNKIKRRKDAERAAKHEAKMKLKDQQVQMIKKLAKSVEEKERSRDAAKSMALAIKAEAEGTLDVQDGEELELRKKQFGRIPYVSHTIHTVTRPPSNMKQYHGSPPRSRAPRRTARLPARTEARRQPTQGPLQEHDAARCCRAKETHPIRQAEEVHRFGEVELQGLGAACSSIDAGRSTVIEFCISGVWIPFVHFTHIAHTVIRTCMLRFIHNINSNTFRSPARPSSSRGIPAYTPPPLPSPLRLFSLTKTHLSTPAKTVTSTINPAQIAIPLTYHGPSSLGKILVPTSGPHCPITFNIAIPVPFPLSLSWLLIVHVIITVMALKNPAIAGYSAKYRISVCGD